MSTMEDKHDIVKNGTVNIYKDFFDEEKKFVKLDKFKVLQCPIKSSDPHYKQHDRRNCPFFHNSNDQRRPTSRFEYEPIQCNNFFIKEDDNSSSVDYQNQKLCPFSDSCKKCHNKYELLYHPKLYKTRFCSCISPPVLRNHLSLNKEAFSGDYTKPLLLSNVNEYLKQEKKSITCPRAALCAFAHDRNEIKRPIYTVKEELLLSILDILPKKNMYTTVNRSFGGCDGDTENKINHNVNIVDGIAISDVHDFFINKYKMTWCPYGKTHEWQKCMYSHTVHDCRRNHELQYLSDPCSSWASAMKSPDTLSDASKHSFRITYAERCSHGIRCSNSHGPKEQLYHPAYYKTKMCYDYHADGLYNDSNCTRGALCAFYHIIHEKRGASESALSGNDAILPSDNMSKLQDNFLELPIFYSTDFEAFGVNSKQSSRASSMTKKSGKNNMYMQNQKNQNTYSNPFFNTNSIQPNLLINSSGQYGTPPFPYKNKIAENRHTYYRVNDTKNNMITNNSIRSHNENRKDYYAQNVNPQMSAPYQNNNTISKNLPFTTQNYINANEENSGEFSTKSLNKALSLLPSNLDISSPRYGVDMNLRNAELLNEKNSILTSGARMNKAPVHRDLNETVPDFVASKYLFGDCMCLPEEEARPQNFNHEYMNNNSRNDDYALLAHLEADMKEKQDIYQLLKHKLGFQGRNQISVDGKVADGYVEKNLMEQHPTLFHPRTYGDTKYFSQNSRNMWMSDENYSIGKYNNGFPESDMNQEKSYFKQ